MISSRHRAACRKKIFLVLPVDVIAALGFFKKFRNLLGLFILGTALNGVHWALYLLMESRFVVDLAFNTPRVPRKVTPKVFLHTPTINLINSTVNKALP